MLQKKKVRKNLRTFFYAFWKQSHNASFCSAWFAIKCFLFFCSLWYRIFFYFYKITRTRTTFSEPIIAVGNISAGGTGKSVVVAFLVHKMRFSCFGIFLRGYARIEKKDSIVIVSGSEAIANSVFTVGDEAAMHAHFLNQFVIVGKKRVLAIEYAKKLLPLKPLAYLLLDDAYQYFAIIPDFSILLIDARKVLEKTYVLPVGELREDDWSRADCIVFSHAQFCSDQERKRLIQCAYQKKIKNIPIVFGYHAVSKIDFWSYELEYQKCLDMQRRVFIVAGIGSFDQFASTVHKLGFVVVGEGEYPDHYTYTLEDIDEIMHAVNELNASVIVTTAKDWVKIYALIHDKNIGLLWGIVYVDFVCTSEAEERILLRAARKAIITKYLSI